RQFDELGARNSRGDVTGFFDVGIAVVDAMQDESRHSDRRQNIAHVNQSIHAEQSHCRSRTTTPALVTRPPVTKVRVVAYAGRNIFDADRAAPLSFYGVTQLLTLLRLWRPWIIGIPYTLGENAERYQRQRSFGISRGEEHRHIPTFRHAEDYSSLRPDSPHN